MSARLRLADHSSPFVVESTLTARTRLERIVSGDVLRLVDEYVREIALDVVRAEVARAALNRPAWYTLEEAARRLGISPDAARMRAKRGRLKTRRQGRRLYVSASSVDELEQPAR